MQRIQYDQCTINSNQRLIKPLFNIFLLKKYHFGLAMGKCNSEMTFGSIYRVTEDTGLHNHHPSVTFLNQAGPCRTSLTKLQMEKKTLHQGNITPLMFYYFSTSVFRYTSVTVRLLFHLDDFQCMNLRQISTRTPSKNLTGVKLLSEVSQSLQQNGAHSSPNYKGDCLCFLAFAIKSIFH